MLSCLPLSGLGPNRPLMSISELFELRGMDILEWRSPRYWSGMRGVGGASRADMLPMLARLRCPGGLPYGMRFGLNADGGYICPPVRLRGLIMPGKDCVEAAAL